MSGESNHIIPPQILRKKTSVGCIVASNVGVKKGESYYFRREQLDELVFR